MLNARADEDIGEILASVRDIERIVARVALKSALPRSCHPSAVFKHNHLPVRQCLAGTELYRVELYSPSGRTKVKRAGATTKLFAA